MTDAEQREDARQFIKRWANKGKEDEDGRSYWIDLLSNVIGMDNVTERLNFEKKSSLMVIPNELMYIYQKHALSSNKKVLAKHLTTKSKIPETLI